jgi:hypothetical protein
MPTMIMGIPQFTLFEGVKQFAKQAIRNLDKAHDATYSQPIAQWQGQFKGVFVHQKSIAI